MTATISVLTATFGRASLVRAMDSFAREVGSGDEHVVVGDGPTPAAEKLVNEVGDPWRWLQFPGPRVPEDFGHSALNMAIPYLLGDLCLVLDDDDELAKGALEAVRAAAEEAPGRPLMFRVRFPNLKKLPWDRRLGVAPHNVAGGMFVFPLKAGRYAKFHGGHGGDFRFIRDTVALYPKGSLVWRPEVVQEHAWFAWGKVPDRGMLGD